MVEDLHHVRGSDLPGRPRLALEADERLVAVGSVPGSASMNLSATGMSSCMWRAGPDRAHPAAPDDALQPELAGDHVARRQAERLVGRGLHAVASSRGRRRLGAGYHDGAVRPNAGLGRLSSRAS